MKRIKRIVGMMFLLTIMLLSSMQVMAAGSAQPGNVSKLSVKANGETKLKFNWSKVSGAKGYIIYRVEGARKTKVAQTAKTNYILKNVKPEQTYQFQVYAFKKAGSQTVLSAAGSPIVSVKTTIKAPGAVTDLKLNSYGNKSLYISWKGGSNKTAYAIFCYNPTTKQFVRVGTSKEKKYVVQNLKDGESYRIKVCAYRATNGGIKYGAFSNELVSTAKTVNYGGIHGWYWKATVKKNMTVSLIGGGTAYLKAGTQVVATSKSGTVQILFNGKSAKVSSSQLRFGNLSTVKTHYTKTQKENFINSRGYSSKTGYFIWISQYTCNVTIFKGSQGKWKQIMSEPCVVGRNGATGSGLFRVLKFGHAYGHPEIFFRWSTRYNNGNAFHARIDSTKQGAASHGCVRCPTNILYFMRNKVPVGTPVLAY